VKTYWKWHFDGGGIHAENLEKWGNLCQGKVTEIVFCLWCATTVVVNHKINMTRVLLSKVDMHKMDCQQWHKIYSRVT